MIRGWLLLSLVACVQPRSNIVQLPRVAAVALVSSDPPGDVGSTHVFFDGDRSLSRAELLAAIQSDDPREFESVIVERDVMLINELYYDHGYVSVRAGRYASGSG